MKQKSLISTIFITALLALPSFGFAYTVSQFNSSDPGDSDTTQQVEGATGTNQSAAVPFTTSAAGTVSSIGICVNKNGSPVDNAVANFYTDSGSAPSTLIASSVGVAASSITTYGGLSVDCSNGGASFVTFNFSSPVTLSASTNYWVVLTRSGARSASNYFIFTMDSSYSGGLHNNSGTWAAVGSGGFYNFTITPSAPSPSPSSNSMDSLLNNATSSFFALTAFNVSDVSSWMWSVLASPIIGGALALALALRYYLIALALLIVVVFFAYKAWQMWRGH